MLSIAAAPFVAAELFFAWRFQRDYPGSTLEIQGAWRFLPAPYRGYRNNPGYVRELDGVRYRYDNLGFRNEEDLVAKQANEFRVFILGGSVAYGERAREQGQWQLISGQKTYPTSDTIGNQLEAILQEQMPGRVVKVFTAATVAYRVHQCYLTYLTLLRNLEPDLIVTIDGANEDYEASNPYAWDPQGGMFAGSGALVRLLREHDYTLFYAGELFRRSALFDWMSGREVVDFPVERLDAMDVAAIRRRSLEARNGYRLPEGVRRGLLGVYDDFHHAAVEDGVPVLFCVQPMLPIDEVKELTPVERRLLAYWSLGNNLAAYGDYALSRVLEQRAEGDPAFHFMNLVGVFADYTGEAYTDTCHLTPAANRHVAERLARGILADPILAAGRR